MEGRTEGVKAMSDSEITEIEGDGAHLHKDLMRGKLLHGLGGLLEGVEAAGGLLDDPGGSLRRVGHLCWLFKELEDKVVYGVMSQQERLKTEKNPPGVRESYI